MTGIACDIAVIGAGAGGVPAAAAAARRGAKTILLEQRGEPGGTMTAGLGFPVCGLFENDTTCPPKLLNSGLPEEFYAAVCKEDSDPVVAMGRVYVCRCSAGLFKTIYRRWMENTDLTFVPQTAGMQIETAGGKIAVLRFRTAAGEEYEIFPSQVIDCTGQGAVIQLSGAERIEPAVLPLAGFSVRLRGVTPDELLPIKVPHQLRRAVGEGILPAWCGFTFFSYGSPDCGEAFLKFSPPASVTKEKVSETAQRAQAVLQRGLPAFRAAEIIERSPDVLQREGSRLKGRCVLSDDDVRTGRRFEDEAALGCWPMEYWDAENGPHYTYAEENRAYGIPARCLRSVNVHNLWTAGRSISAASGALSSARVIGTAMATGEAAGAAAAESLK
jgi:hypothetical protein